MKIIFTWEEFAQAAIERLTEKHVQLRGSCGMPVFMQKYGYEADGEAHTFPPAYVEFEVRQ
jgi:hypothetical protein